MTKAKKASDEKRERIAKLEHLAIEISEFVQSRKRPLIVEFSGIPKAGKTTAVNSLALFLRRNGIRVKVVTERASVCPIREKHHPFFNVWTASTSLVQILDLLQSREFNVIVVDRGIYDSLIWLKLLHNIGKMTRSELVTIQEFLMLDRWMRQVDLVLHMTTTPESALDREFASLLTEKEGSIMNSATLSEYLKAATETEHQFGPKFKKLISIDTTSKRTIDGVEQITRAVLEALKELSDEELVVVPRERFLAEFGGDVFLGGTTALRRLKEFVTKHGRSVKRSAAEADEQLVQLIVCATIRHKDEVLVFTKREISAKQRFHGKQLLWIGGHVRWDDIHAAEPTTFLASLRGCLRREMEEEISLSRGKVAFSGLLYDRTSTKSMQHVAVLFEQVVDSRTRTFLDSRTFREYAGQELDTHFEQPGDVVQRADEFEPWSVEILRQVFQMNVADARRADQLLML